ncbi:hypothetical protein C0Q70_08162 [Pomacea canaliculata]|uniref:Uncharacterized protein n=1 Tax=Pomacea canaliculata TaxID=400727 RepID=A0A2T7PH42_POMCA|nr:hypothetical protein C0Q70_08162 [Pomacea canaliculata]
MAKASGQGGQDDQHPFSLAWINSCYHQTLLPDAPWHKLESRVARALAGHVEKQFGNPQRREMLLELLGKHYVDTYLSHVKRNPQELGSLSGEEYERLKVEASSWLNNQMYRAVKDVGLEVTLSGAAAREEAPVPKEYQDFMQHTHILVSNGLDRQLYKQEQVLKEEKEKELQNPQKAQNVDFFKVPAPSRMKPVSTIGTSSSVASVPKPTSAQMRGMIHTLEGDPPPLWGHQSENIGAAVVALLQRDPKKFGHVVDSLHGRQLPGSLRAYIWADVLFKAKRRHAKEVYSEKVIRERFARAVTRGLTELKIKKPTQSPIKGLIDNAVVETYSKTVSMVPYKHPQHLKETSRALNVLYVFDRSYESFLVYWLFPLQIAFRIKDQYSDDKGEHVLELAMYLDLLNAGCFPTWPEVFAIAECVMQQLQQEDPEFHDHLKSIATINVQGSPKEFLVQLIHREREQAEAFLQSVPNTSRSMDQSAHQLLADPLIFLRRCYVCLGPVLHAVLETLSASKCVPGTARTTASLFHGGTRLPPNERGVSKRKHASFIQLMYKWPGFMLRLESTSLDIPFLNRQRPGTPSSRLAMPQSPSSTPGPSSLQEFGIKHLQVKLIIPAELVQREAWLTLLDPAGLCLHCTIYFGTIQLQSKTSTTSPVLVSADKDSYGNMVYVVRFPKEKFVYPSYDIVQYDVERELGASMYAVISVEYRLPSTSKSKDANVEVLGWSRLPLFRQTITSRGQETFMLLEGETQVALHPGKITLSFHTAQPASPTQPSEDVFLGYNSELESLVFDPNREPVTPPLSSTPQPKPATQRTPRLPPAVPPADTQQHRTPTQPKVTPEQPKLPPKSVTPAKPSPQPPDPDPWVAFSTKTKNPSPTTSRDPFDFYVDSVRYIPDNASIIKVTGRILKGGELTSLQDILALPLLQGPARCPAFDFRLLVNSEGKQANPETLLLLRVYTVDMITEKVVVVGSCLLKVFDTTKRKEGLLRVGGHQLRLRSGMPDVRQGISNLKHTDLDFAPAVPACSLLVRLLPCSQDPVPAPLYSSGYYQSSDCQPTISEQRIFASYTEHMAYPQTERDMILRLQTVENKQTGKES